MNRLVQMMIAHLEVEILKSALVVTVPSCPRNESEQCNLKAEHNTASATQYHAIASSLMHNNKQQWIHTSSNQYEADRGAAISSTSSKTIDYSLLPSYKATLCRSIIVIMSLASLFLASSGH